MRVLLLENEDLLRRVVAADLRHAGIEVIEAATGAEAQCAMDHGEIDVLVADMRLPGHLTGWRVARYCRECVPMLPIIYISASPAEGARDGPGTAYLRRPFRPSELVSLVLRFADRLGVEAAPGSAPG